MIADHVRTYYAHTVAGTPARRPLNGDIETDVCVIGGGMAGLSTALGLAERGRRVVVLEQHRIAWGASGRNAGFVGAGFAGEPLNLPRRVGAEPARKLYSLTIEAVELVRRRIRDFAIPCDFVAGGTIEAWWTDSADNTRSYQDRMAKTFGVELEFWPRERLRQALRTTRYFDGLYNPRSFSFHPLKYALGIATAIEARGGQIFETSPAVNHELEGPLKTIRTNSGSVRARQVVFAGGGYMQNLHRPLAAAIQPISTYIMVTEPLGETLAQAIRCQAGVIDSRFDFDYYRPLSDTRILWGGGITIGQRDPQYLSEWLRRRMLAVYPQLAGVRADFAWSGFMPYPRHSMPLIGQVSPDVWYATGFGGNGMATTAMAGELVAGAIAQGDDRYRLFAPFGLDWTGGIIGLGAVQATYWYYKLRDALRR
jgi:gamma-glutamylputrescine oxidase